MRTKSFTLISGWLFSFIRGDFILELLITQAKLKSDNTFYAERSARDAFYQSHTWRIKRKAILNRDNNECQVCKAIGIVALDNLIVHHILTLEYHPELALMDSNLITVCQACHNQIHELTVKRFNDEWW